MTVEPCLCGDPGCPRCFAQGGDEEPVTDVDDFEVIAEDDHLIVACPDRTCQRREAFEDGWWASIGDIIRAAREHQHWRSRNGNAPETWVVISGVGGYVCAVPDPTRTGGICGMPTESEPCPEHAPEVSG